MDRIVQFFKPSIDEADITGVLECLRSGWLTSGPRVAEFETQFSSFLGSDVSSVAVNSATSALHLGLEALGVTCGDEVILPTWTFTATAEIVRYLGATPIICDINPETLCVEASNIEPLITSRTRAIIVVHFAGLMCNMNEISSLARNYNLKVLEDAAHAFPASYQNQLVGTSGSDACAFSFYANKTITTGEGGMLVSSNPEIINRAKIMRLHGINRDVFNRFTDVNASYYYDVVEAGFKYNMTDISASLGITQLSKAHQLQRKRSMLAERYSQLLAHLDIKLPTQPLCKNDIHSWHLYCILLPTYHLTRDEIAAKLQAKGVSVSLHYTPLHRLTYWKSFCVNLTYPNAESIFPRILSLPLFPEMTFEDQDYVVAALETTLSESL